MPVKVCLMCLCLFFCIRLAAQEMTPEPDDVANHPWYVFVQRSIDTTGLDRLLFVDALTGEQTSLDIYGERYTPLEDRLLYFDTASRQVMLAAPDGATRPHPFIQGTSETRRIDWVVADDQRYIAWTLTNADAFGRLTTETMVARLDGSESRLVLTDGPRGDGLRVLPLSFSTDQRTLYMDLHPDGLSSFMALAQYAGLFALDLETGAITPLPGEEERGCLCGAGIGAGWFLRFGLSDDQSGYDVRVYNLAGGVEMAALVANIPAPRLRNYTVAGDVLITPDGTRAVYALAQVNSANTTQPTIRTVFVLIDLTTMTQETLTDPITTFVRPLAWTEGGTTIAFTSPNRDGTWKISLADRRLDRIAEAAYIGTLTRTQSG